MVDLLAQDAAEVGGKAMGLALLGTSGMPVPDAVVIPVRWFWRHLERCGLDPRVPGGPDAAAIAAALPGTTLDPELAGALRVVGASLGPRVAVRSSAVGEDAAGASHAGQYATLLGVRPGDDLEQAVVSCWASAFSGHVQVYREARAGRGSTVAGMAVVVQKMIEPRCAGVVFTINPSSGSWAEMTVEAAWGLGEAVVSGRVVPDFYGVRRPRRLPRVVQRLVAHVRLEETTREVQSQDRQLIGVGSGVEEVPVPVELRAQPKLTTDQVLRLCRLALRVEARAGLPQDIEWAMDDNGAFYVLQARPVTTAREVRPSGAQVWTRRFVGERWTEPATPLGWSLMGGLLDWFVDYPEVSRKYLGGGAATRLYRSAPYLNTTVFRHLAFKAPGARPPRFMLELLPPHEELDWLRRRAQMPDLRVYGAIFATTFKERRWRRFRWNPVRNPVHWDAYERLLDDALVPMASPCQSRAEALARTDRCMDLAREYIKVHVCSLLFANLWYEVAGAMLVSRGAGDPDLLLRPAAPTWTVQTAHALWALGAGKLSEPDLLARFGHRSTSSWALFAVRWSEQPEMVRQLVESTVGGGDPLPPVLRAVAQADEAMAALSPDLRAVVGLTRRYLQLREDQRFHFDRLLACWKDAWVFLEREEGVELRFLDSAEADAFLGGTLSRGDVAERVARRKGEWSDEVRRWAEGDGPPTFLGGDGTAEPDGARIQGLGISSGTAKGLVRVIRHLGEAHLLRPGEILVARATDPGWTPLFLRASGMVLELGGMLSHGAVVARELGLPAVVNVSDACRRLQTGQAVTIDGSRGRVYVH